MQLSRRRVLQGIGASVAAGLLAGPASATETDTDRERVFVHPRTGLLDELGELVSVIEVVGGTTVLEYDNFEFVVAEVPSNRLDELRTAAGVASVEDDEETGIPSGWSPSLLDLLLSPDADDCSTHPNQRASWGLERIGADTVEPDGTGVDVGILDTGVESAHCSVSVAGGRNFTRDGVSSDYEDRHGHGTHVAGVAGAVDNDIGVVGAAPGADLYAVKVLGDDGSGRYSELIAGIDWCMSNDVEVISMSLGGESESDAVDRAIEEAHSAGHLLVCAAGNEGNVVDGSCEAETMTYPATHPDVVAVTAMDEDDTLASYSSVGAAVDLLAPGTDIVSATVGNEYAEASGTSVATPFVSGVAALLWQTRDEAGPGPNEPIREILAETAETVLETCEEGAGLVDAHAALGDGRATDGDDGDGPRDDESAVGGSAGSLLERVASAVGRIIDLVAGALARLRGLFS